MLVLIDKVLRTIKTKAWCAVIVCAVVIVMEASALNGDNVCMVKQKYNITKRVKYRAPMSVRTYEWCFSMPPRCSKWSTEIRDLTRLETEERTAEVAVCCPGYKMRDVSCVPICPLGKTGPGCSEDCPDNKWGPNCINECKRCKKGFCSPVTGECECLDGWQGESCDASMPSTTATTSLEELLTVLTTKNTILATPKVTTVSTTVSTPSTTAAIPSTTVTTPRTSITTPSVTTSTTAVTTPTTTVAPVTTAAPATTVAAETTAGPATTVALVATVAPATTVASATTVTPETTVAPTTKITTIEAAILPIKNTLTTSTMSSSSSNLTTDIQEAAVKNIPIFTSLKIPKIITMYDNTTFVTTSTSKTARPTIEAATQKVNIEQISNRTEDLEITTEPVIVIFTNKIQQKPTAEVPTTTDMPTTVLSTTPVEATSNTETTKKETTTRTFPTTVKFKPKEIWIRPAQKGESPIVETKIKTAHEFPRYRSANNKDNKEITPVITTPKTIIVSIIPTSVSYSTFKKIAFTSSFISAKNSSTAQSYHKSENEFTKPMLTETTTPPVKLSPLSRKDLLSTSYFINKTLVPSTSVTTKPTTSSTKLTALVTKPLEVSKTTSHINKTNSMSTDINKNVFTSITTTSSNTTRTTLKQNHLLTAPTTTTSLITSSVTQTSTRQTAKHLLKYATPKKANVSAVTKQYIKPTNPPTVVEKEIKKVNFTKSFDKVTTDGPTDDEEFHILTEPEHITAVMGEKGTERSSVDLISVISIAGGVMMAVITVAVVIVMIERCKKPRYEDVRKINDIRMQVMIDNNDVPPPYVRSIFHTPLPDPPTSEKCHYQPISTLDRNLKQFMRPVVVQTISPIMLENFRGILECHYDHLPRRSNDFATIQTRSSIAPSMSDCSELRQLRASVTESAIEALKCEAKLDVIDNTTSEPLYAEIPCWRPPSEHAIEIMNLNGEAVTEL